MNDPYVITGDKICDPPSSFFHKIRFLGPGLILSASIVGSGELIATTRLGAEAGYITFWIILVSCFVKVAIQMEFGRYAILTGESVMRAFNRLPGPKFQNAHWTIWSWVILMSFKMLQVGGVVGGVGIILNLAIPFLSVEVWTFSVAILVALLVFRGYYRWIEVISISLIGLFTLFTLICLVALQYTPYAISWENIVSGLSFQLPSGLVGVAIAAFGLTGVGGDEIMYYNYWCIEKGYAAYTGPKEDSIAWRERAKGWINVMYWDAVIAMIVYTTVTAAFYLLGAAVLHVRQDIPEGFSMIESLSNMYTESLGPWAKTVFLTGGFIVLFSTLFAALASWIRVYTDAFGQLGWIDFFSLESRKKTLAFLAWFFPIGWAIFFVFVRLPVYMVLTGGIITSIILFIVVYAAWYFRYRVMDRELIGGKGIDAFFWLSSISIMLIGFYGIVKLFL